MAAEEKDPEKREVSAPISGWLFQKSWVFHRGICRCLEADALGRVEEKAGEGRARPGAYRPDYPSCGMSAGFLRTRHGGSGLNRNKNAPKVAYLLSRLAVFSLAHTHHYSGSSEGSG